MKIALVRTLGGLKPAFDSDNDMLKKIPLDTILEYEVRVGRNIQFHKKFFALLNLTFSNQEEFTNFNVFRDAVVIGAGFYEEVQRLGGEMTIEAKSISFSKMDEMEFQELYGKVLDTIIEYFKFPRQGIEEEIAKFY